MIQIAPLSSGFMLTSMLGFIISILFVYPKFSKSYGVAFALVFIVMFISSVISFINAPVEEYPGAGKKKI
jgi:hypothetical protein